ncbi:hypothetical protein PF006_g17730 [Phytophthora fragariae]|uniref:ZSWIM1/3 RNaseH-like domain-containing protein n=1 Tax=Phytophthora fragariae TaxID=53985 RepID=A0A6A3SRM0_9STRA|nr:hypothetical protein PF006_g17730 [Phytophthora fragariae]
MHGNSSAAERLKNLLHELKQVDGSEVLVIQDDLDITCGIVIQTRVQKLACEQWGENLTLDFTHGTNNLGYHLGSFVATGPIGRGIPVLDFLALNETADIMTEIFEFFKRTNPTTWENIQTFVIDKHFVEWKVLERCFPDMKVLLCQFHALTYWKRLLGRKFGLKPAQRDVAQRCFAKMMYRSVFDPVLEGLARLGSFNFYKQIQLWEGVITKFMADNGAPPGDELNEKTEETRTDSDSDCTLELDNDFFDLTDMLVPDDDAMTYEVPSVEKQLAQPTTLPSATLQASATLVPCGTTLLQNKAKLLTPATTLTPVSALTDVKAPPPHAPCRLEGPGWNLADFDSCPYASQVSLGTLNISELSQTVVGVNGDSVVTCQSQEDPGDGSEDTSDAAMSLLACAAG